ncbi:MAG TPA: SDR family NAD(P)-dependent oxidoreductase, partial [Vicinamibacteria bacterium]|nr:SDR family NAD(P)-dependent oxidoreductase [Vicinamibacteria bacterium]
MRIALLGGTKGIGRAIARLVGEKGHDLCLMGRNAAELEASARDVETRSDPRRTVHVVRCDLLLPETFAPALDQAAEKLGGLDTVIVTAGLIRKQEELEADRNAARDLLTVNFAHTVLFCEEARERLLAAGGGTLCVLSSVAGE